MASSSEIDMPKTGRTNSTITIFFLNPEGEDHWYLSPRVMNSFKAGGIPWKSSMQYIMWQKAMVFDDQDVAASILENSSPDSAYCSGSKVKGFDDGVWNARQIKILEDASYYNFTQSYVLKSYLLDTGSAYLVNADPEDVVWGIGYTSDQAENNRSTWGSNLLGRTLMAVRERIRGEDQDLMAAAAAAAAAAKSKGILPQGDPSLSVMTDVLPLYIAVKQLRASYEVNRSAKDPDTRQKLIGEVHKHAEDLAGMYGKLGRMSLREEEGLRAVAKPVYDTVKKFKAIGDFSDQAEEAWEGICGTSRSFKTWAEDKRALKK